MGVEGVKQHHILQYHLLYFGIPVVQTKDSQSGFLWYQVSLVPGLLIHQTN